MCTRSVSIIYDNASHCLLSIWGLRIIDSQDIGIYSAGLYSFFSNYNICMDSFALLLISDLEESVQLIVDSVLVPKPNQAVRKVSSVLKATGHGISASTSLILSAQAA